MPRRTMGGLLDELEASDTLMMLSGRGAAFVLYAMKFGEVAGRKKEAGAPYSESGVGKLARSRKPARLPSGSPRGQRNELAELRFDIQSLYERDKTMQKLLDGAEDDARAFRRIRERV